METDFSMNDLKKNGFVCGIVSHNGRRVLLETESLRSGSWSLRIIGREGLVSEWSDPFDSAAEAIVVGLAVLHSRIGEFCDDSL